MAKVKLLPEEIEMYQLDEEGKAYIEYNEKVGGEPFGYSFDGLSLVGKFDNITELYKECIKQNKTWEELLKD
jgi:hypothetical protein